MNENRVVTNDRSQSEKKEIEIDNEREKDGRADDRREIQRKKRRES